jgi:hypothetical protein
MIKVNNPPVNIGMICGQHGNLPIFFPLDYNNQYKPVATQISQNIGCVPIPYMVKNSSPI